MDITKQIKETIVKAISVFAGEFCLTDNFIQICVVPNQDLSPVFVITSTHILNEQKNGLLQTVQFEDSDLKIIDFVSLMLQANEKKWDWNGQYKIVGAMYVEPYFKKIFKFVCKEFNVENPTDVKIVFFTNSEKVVEEKIFLALYNGQTLIKQIKEKELIEYSEKL